jgi:hypothetical protein
MSSPTLPCTAPFAMVMTLCSKNTKISLGDGSHSEILKPKLGTNGLLRVSRERLDELDITRPENDLEKGGM